MKNATASIVAAAMTAFSPALAQTDFDEELLGPFDSNPSNPMVYEPPDKCFSFTALEVLQISYHVPDTLSDRAFWGYNTHEAVDDNFLALPAAVAPALSIHNAISDNIWRTHKRKISENKECDSYHLEEVELDDEELLHAKHYEDEFERITKIFEDSTEDIGYSSKEKNSLVYEALLYSYRQIIYENTGLNTDPPKLLPELRKNHSGDCEDFAIARYITALELGINPDSLAIFVFLHPANIGHAVLGHYNEDLQEWLLIDGTGRNHLEELGSTFIASNTQDIKDMFLNNGSYFAEAIPYLAITHNGIAAFDVFDEDKEFKQAISMPKSDSNVFQYIPGQPLADLLAYEEYMSGLEFSLRHRFFPQLPERGY